MYNRYIPQADGSYRRNPTQESRPQRPPVPPPPPQPPPSIPHRPPPAESVTGFLRQLLPKGFDTGDLIVVLLLLLMAGDCKEDQNWAVLTLVLYLFL